MYKLYLDDIKEKCLELDVEVKMFFTETNMYMRFKHNRSETELRVPKKLFEKPKTLTRIMEKIKEVSKGE